MAFAIQVLSFPALYADISTLQETSYKVQRGGKELNQWLLPFISNGMRREPN